MASATRRIQPWYNGTAHRSRRHLFLRGKRSPLSSLCKSPVSLLDSPGWASEATSHPLHCPLATMYGPTLHIPTYRWLAGATYTTMGCRTPIQAASCMVRGVWVVTA